MLTAEEVQAAMAVELPIVTRSILTEFERKRAEIAAGGRDFSFSRTRTGVRWNAIVEVVKDVFNQADGLLARERRGTMQFWCFRLGTPIEFKFRRLDRRLRASTNTTHAALSFFEQNGQVMLPNVGMVPAASVVLGYTMNALEEVERIVMAMPSGRYAFHWVTDLWDRENEGLGGNGGTPVAPIMPSSPVVPAAEWTILPASSIVRAEGSSEV